MQNFETRLDDTIYSKVTYLTTPLLVTIRAEVTLNTLSKRSSLYQLILFKDLKNNNNNNVMSRESEHKHRARAY